MPKVRIPSIREPIVDDTGRLTSPWYQFLYNEWLVTGGDQDAVTEANEAVSHDFGAGAATVAADGVRSYADVVSLPHQPLLAELLARVVQLEYQIQQLTLLQAAQPRDDDSERNLWLDNFAN